MIQDRCWSKAEIWAILRMQQFFRQTMGIELDQDFCETIYSSFLERAFRQAWDAQHRPDFCTSSPDYIDGVFVGEGCLQHDIDYMLGNISRKEADKKLRDSIYDLLRKAGKGKIRAMLVARVYYRAVRSFGWRGYQK